jgi:hypothetical protein
MILCGYEDYGEMEKFGRLGLDFLKGFLELPKGIFLSFRLTGFGLEDLSLTAVSFTKKESLRPRRFVKRAQDVLPVFVYGNSDELSGMAGSSFRPAFWQREQTCMANGFFPAWLTPF